MTDALIADMIAIVGSLDGVMGEVDREPVRRDPGGGGEVPAGLAFGPFCPRSGLRRPNTAGCRLDVLRRGRGRLEETPPTSIRSRRSTTSSSSSRRRASRRGLHQRPRAPSSAHSRSRAFEGSLGVVAGETSPDGKATLRTIELPGRCGWGTVVSVDHAYRLRVTPDDVPGIVQELTGGRLTCSRSSSRAADDHDLDEPRRLRAVAATGPREAVPCRERR